MFFLQVSDIYLLTLISTKKIEKSKILRGKFHTLGVNHKFIIIFFD